MKDSNQIQAIQLIFRLRETQPKTRSTLLGASSKVYAMFIVARLRKSEGFQTGKYLNKDKKSL